MTDMERKLRLTRFVREENALNRKKMRNRENILYGNGKILSDDDELPLVYDGYLEEGEYRGMPSSSNAASSSFGLRTFLAILLFAAVVYTDKKGILFQGNLIAPEIARQVTVSDEGKLIDFMENFPYPLSDKNK